MCVVSWHARLAFSPTCAAIRAVNVRTIYSLHQPFITCTLVCVRGFPLVVWANMDDDDDDNVNAIPVKFKTRKEENESTLDLSVVAAKAAAAFLSLLLHAFCARRGPAPAHLSTTKRGTINPGSYNGFEHLLIAAASSVLYAASSRPLGRPAAASTYNLFIVMLSMPGGRTDGWVPRFGPFIVV